MKRGKKSLNVKLKLHVVGPYAPSHEIFIIYIYIYIYGETTQLVPEVYPMCAISPSSLKRAQLVP